MVRMERWDPVSKCREGSFRTSDELFTLTIGRPKDDSCGHIISDLKFLESC